MTAKRPYRIAKGSIQERFFNSRMKLQMYAGGFGNGKTSAVTVRAIQIAKDYPGSNILVARETFPKVNDTIRKEFIQWMPAAWVKKLPTDNSNEMILHNGTIINFRYIAQQGKGSEQASSNLLSANYDLIIVDQVEDPKITHKDFTDLFGRLRGQTPYKGDDATMPRSGPRWMFLTANPTRNWVYRKIVHPFHLWKKNKIKHPDLIVDKDGNAWMDVFESSTIDNADNLPEDYIDGLRTAYKGQSFDRYVGGEWSAYEGLVYPEFNPAVHVVPYDNMAELIQRLNRFTIEVTWCKGFDHGLSSQSCYLLAFADAVGNVHIIDGIYEKEIKAQAMSLQIKELNKKYNVPDKIVTYADPSIFRRAGDKGETVADIFIGYGVPMVRANNNIISGIEKVAGYMIPQLMNRNPYTGNYGSPKLFIADTLTWWIDEISDYIWKKDTSGETTDIPRDAKDHAMDTTKYLFTTRPKIATIRPKAPSNDDLMVWREHDDFDSDRRNKSRHVG